jgi:glycosyltransferase involved in cell wall biosynthesis
VNPRAAHPPDISTAEQTRAEFGSALPSRPLPAVPFRPCGLLAELPPAPANRTGWPWTVETPPTTTQPSSSPGLSPATARISIVTPAFQHGRYLEETIRSVLLQNYPNLEYIVIDGGSDDETPAILEKYRPWLSFARSSPDRGQGHAINLGFSLASGSLLGWLNSDDFYLPGAFTTLSVTAAKSPAYFFYGDGLELRESDNSLRYALAPLVSARYRHFGGIIFSHAAFWRDSIHEPIWEAMRCNVDGELWQRLLPGRRLRYIPQPLGLVRIQPDAKTVHPRHREAWAADAEKYQALHGRWPAPRSWLSYEHRYVQRFIAWKRSRMARPLRAKILSLCAWAKLPSLPGDV